MRELGQIIKEKVVRLFLTGHSYEDIAQQLDIAKGSVTNIIDEFRDGQISIPGDMADYVNELRRIAVDLRKHQVSLNQLRSYQKLHKKLNDMGADSEKVEQWLDLLQVKAVTNTASDKYFDVVGWIADWSAETGKHCKDILSEYDEKLGSLDYFDEEIEKKQEQLEELQQEEEKISEQIATLKQELNQIEEVCSKRKKEIDAHLEDYLARNNLSWRKVQTVKAAMDGVLRQADLSPDKLESFYEQLRKVGSLSKAVCRLEGEVEHLKLISSIYKKKSGAVGKSNQNILVIKG